MGLRALRHYPWDYRGRVGAALLALIKDAPDAQPTQVPRGEARFDHVDFAYQPDRLVLEDVHLIHRAASVNHTTLAIPHRPSTIIDADRILIMQNGRLVESGTHGELLAANGESTRLWHTQREAREDAPA